MIIVTEPAAAIVIRAVEKIRKGRLVFLKIPRLRHPPEPNVKDVQAMVTVSAAGAVQVVEPVSQIMVIV